MAVMEKLVDVHGKLMGLLQRAPYIRCEDVHRQYAVNWLMNNGVTVQDNTEISDELLKQLRNAPLTVFHEEPTIELVQEWISVRDRLPEEYTYVLVCDVREDYVAEWEYRRNGVWHHEGCYYDNGDLTHWMPLSQPPKGE